MEWIDPDTIRLKRLSIDCICPSNIKLDVRIPFHNPLLASFTIAVYTLGYRIGPFVIAPESEIYGRAKILHAGNVVMLVCLAACSRSTSLAVFIVFRLIMGFAACPWVVLGSGLFADLLPTEKCGHVGLVCWPYSGVPRYHL